MEPNLNKSQELLKKLQALRDAPGTSGEGRAAQAAIDRINKRLSNNAEDTTRSKPVENKSTMHKSKSNTNDWSSHTSKKVVPAGYYSFHKRFPDHNATYTGRFYERSTAQDQLDKLKSKHKDLELAAVVRHNGEGKWTYHNGSEHTLQSDANFHIINSD